MMMTMVIIRRAQLIVAANSNSKQQLLFKRQLSLTAALLDSRFPSIMVMIMVMVRIICIFKNMHIGDLLQTTPAAQQHLAQTVNYAQV